jgi:hypothetical protein
MMSASAPAGFRLPRFGSTALRALTLSYGLTLGGCAESLIHTSYDWDHCLNRLAFDNRSGFFVDGAIDPAEFVSIRHAWYETWDLDRSGDLDSSEVGACFNSLDWGSADATFARWDRNDDQVLVLSEFLPRESYVARDSDADALVQYEEWVLVAPQAARVSLASPD